MAKRKRYTDEFRASTVLMLQAAGYPDTPGALSRVSAKVEVDRRTIRRWFTKEQNPPPGELAHEKKIDLVQAIKDELAGILEAMPGEREEANYRELGTVFGIMVDKLQLLSGEPTERTEINWRKEVAQAGINAGELFEHMVQQFASAIETSDRGTDG